MYQYDAEVFVVLSTVHELHVVVYNRYYKQLFFLQRLRICVWSLDILQSITLRVFQYYSRLESIVHYESASTTVG